MAPWLLVSISVVASYALVRAYQRSSPGTWNLEFFSSRSSNGELGLEEKHAQGTGRTGWRGTVDLEGGGSLTLRLAPYHGLDVLEEFRSETLRVRHVLAEGELYRVAISRSQADGTSSAWEISGIEILVGGEACVVDLARALRTSGSARSGDPLLVLLGQSSTRLLAGELRPIAGWGRMPATAESGSIEARVFAADRQWSIALEPTEFEADELPRWFGRSASAPSSRVSSLEARVEELEDELREERLRHLEFVKGIAEFKSSEWFGAVEDEEDASGPTDEADETEAQPEAPDPIALRSAELEQSLRTLFRVTGLYGLDLLNVGRLSEGALGPILFRILDDRGRLTGTLAAERLRLEASRAARKLTIVLEDGFESYGGRRIAFDGGVRRIALDVDPEPWIETLPELFSEADLSPAEDDGIWVHRTLRAELNRLLTLNTSAGWFRVHSFGGVLGSEIISVHIEEFGRDGRVRRRLFADRMRIRVDDGHVRLELEGGAILRGHEREPFRDGLHVIHLARALASDWRAVKLPGVATGAPGYK